MASIEVILYTSKILKNNEHPIMVRLIKDRKPKYISVGASCSKELWDNKKNLPSKKHPLFRELSIKIENTKTEAKRLLLTLEDTKSDFSAEEFTKKFKNQTKKITVLQFLDLTIQELEAVNKIGNANVYINLKRTIQRFKKNKDFTFTDLDLNFLKKYEQDFRERGVSENAMSVHFRTLRALYNRAVSADFAKKESDPFSDFKVSKFNTKTKKRAIKKEEILKIASLNLEEGSRVFNSQKVFMFSYYCSGINIGDIALLETKNIDSDFLIYTREKTNQEIKLKLLEPAKEIINHFRRYNHGDYIFPYLDKKKHRDIAQIKNRIKKITKQINQDLKILAQMADIGTNLTTYVARHTFATTLKKSGVEITKISELMGHDSIQTTQIYLDSFDTEELYEATQNLL